MHSDREMIRQVRYYLRLFTEALSERRGFAPTSSAKQGTAVQFTTTGKVVPDTTSKQRPIPSSDERAFAPASDAKQGTNIQFTPEKSVVPSEPGDAESDKGTSSE